MYVLNCENMNKLERSAVENGDSFLRLMQNAGRAVFEFIIGNLKKATKKVVVLCGKGNNGGDGFVIAELLSDACVDVNVVLTSGEPGTEIADFYFKRVLKKSIPVLKYCNENKDRVFSLIDDATLVVDSIFGIGFKGEPREDMACLFKRVNSSKAKVISVDLPSGLSCDGLLVKGEFIKADYTVTFSALKPVNVLYPTSDYCGQVLVRSVGIEENLYKAVGYEMKVIDKEVLANVLKPRKLSANKGSFGRLLSICGKYGMAGAAILAAKAALRSGVGLVEAAVVKSIYQVMASNVLEPVYTVLEETKNKSISKENKELIKERLKQASACLIGCGLGTDDDVLEILKCVVENSEVPVIIDADAINVLAKNLEILKKAKAPIILTPHPGEMARLLKTTVSEVQSDRMNTAKEFSMKHNVYLVLKGANTIVAEPCGEVYVNVNGNPGMAKGGSGDVLSGITASLAAQNSDITSSVLSAVYIHGAIGDRCVAKYSQISMTPSDMIEELNQFFSDYEKGSL